ncbi:hypothetical protein NPIL_292211 [Nephila pilipes]|uniref:Uncharacterized protein n=1 Tax=Nephila pilipes TaxID=299642 RepID=A0A8X6NYH5_NEPPI|nr:hypothetical protein NPIL_292211 [Nephila pilipes]
MLMPHFFKKNVPKSRMTSITRSSASVPPDKNVFGRRVGSSEDMELRKLLMNEVDAAALRRMSNPSPPSSAPPKKQVSVRPSQDAVAATSHADDNEMDQCWDSESEDSPMNSGPLDLNSLAVYVANQTTIDGTLEAIRALRGQETRINSVNFPSEA